MTTDNPRKVQSQCKCSDCIFLSHMDGYSAWCDETHAGGPVHIIEDEAWLRDCPGYRREPN